MCAAASTAGSRVDLDNPDTYAELDPAGMVSFALGFPQQVKDAATIGRQFAPPKAFREPKHIVLAGMGGSAVGGDFLSQLCAGTLSAPFVVSRDYQMPGFVNRDTLFICSSHSGNTEETLSAASSALRREASILCLTTGGKLADFARRHRGRRAALLQLPRTDPPMPPRAALGYSLITLVRAFETMGLYPGAGRQIGEAIGLLEHLCQRLKPEVPTAHNRAKQLARELHRRVPWVQGTVGIMSAAAYRWRTQFNENSKMLAYSSEYPELNHNEVVGWEEADWLSDLVSVIILRSPSDYWRVRARVDITQKKLIGSKAPVHLVEAEGRSPLAQLLWTVYLGDWISLYLAFLNGVDPASIDSINTLKEDLEHLERPGK
ncbi:MAG: bifunctional phosphoglucose/phosphomannose isomerase [Armatimonadetes bacterium]|nr:bifunctional phosphoglucose/phosphomannose isomerase [Armatimonadota bacterium]